MLRVAAGRSPAATLNMPFSCPVLVPGCEATAGFGKGRPGPYANRLLKPFMWPDTCLTRTVDRYLATWVSSNIMNLPWDGFPLVGSGTGSSTGNENVKGGSEE